MLRSFLVCNLAVATAADGHRRALRCAVTAAPVHLGEDDPAGLGRVYPCDDGCYLVADQGARILDDDHCAVVAEAHALLALAPLAADRDVDVLAGCEGYPDGI